MPSAKRSQTTTPAPTEQALSISREFSDHQSAEKPQRFASTAAAKHLQGLEEILDPEATASLILPLRGRGGWASPSPEPSQREQAFTRRSDPTPLRSPPTRRKRDFAKKETAQGIEVAVKVHERQEKITHRPLSPLDMGSKEEFMAYAQEEDTSISRTIHRGRVTTRATTPTAPQREADKEAPSPTSLLPPIVQKGTHLPSDKDWVQENPFLTEPGPREDGVPVNLDQKYLEFLDFVDYSFTPGAQGLLYCTAAEN
ncbi:hypothetical protein CYMTET_25786 [Cymbomonas tetramitiformis]|uniref:Uncharacterized protein n=1 Tax=Cymbomonas tetramitiformis TaxID=36881 RepID=A0AAE0KYW0_9CHLO|nr:hypothetical protein CYMTET_25786 [Cymbomonas tetramitiformis]